MLIGELSRDSYSRWIEPSCCVVAAGWTFDRSSIFCTDSDSRGPDTSNGSIGFSWSFSSLSYFYSLSRSSFNSISSSSPQLASSISFATSWFTGSADFYSSMTTKLSLNGFGASFTCGCSSFFFPDSIAKISSSSLVLSVDSIFGVAKAENGSSLLFGSVGWFRKLKISSFLAGVFSAEPSAILELKKMGVSVVLLDETWSFSA